MRAQGAAPEVFAGPRGGLTTAGNTASISQLGLPELVIARLEREGVRDLHDWRRLGRKRHAIFGITSRMVREIDAAARKVAA